MSDSAQSAVELVNVTKRFGHANSTPVVNNLSLSIRPGEFFSLLGPSGCGKTTTLRMLAGLELPDAGEILLHGEDVTAEPPYRRGVNMVFQSYALFPHLSVWDNIGYGLKRSRVPAAQRKQRIRDMLQLVQLDSHVDRRPSQLSGGQQQRVALARALVNQPAALLLDEPLAALDATMRATMQSELRRIQQELGMTFVFVTHDQAEAFAMSDRIAIMADGRLSQLGSPESLYQRPETRFVAEFVGRSNVLSGDSTRRDGRTRLVTDEHSAVVLPDGCTGPVQVLVRPESIRLQRQPPADAVGEQSMARGYVVRCTYLGSARSVGVEVTGLGTLEAVVAATDAHRFEIGEQVWAVWSNQDSYLLSH